MPKEEGGTENQPHPVLSLAFPRKPYTEQESGNPELRTLTVERTSSQVRASAVQGGMESERRGFKSSHFFPYELKDLEL